jgi:tetratricopeptide (TPR) repeat protein/predicted Ser/Thr protein kinase
MMPAMLPGERVDGRFELHERVGIGGMGEVFQALDTATGQLVALKLIRDPSDRARFEQEARALGGLHHPAIVRLVAHGLTARGEAYLAMEWLQGEDLSALLRRRRLGIDEVLSLARQVAGALGQAHAHGMIHRDIKPSNLFLEHGEVSRVRLLDFGIARLNGQPRMTRTGMIIGTPGYMAPEQARGDTSLTPALDVFSLGCVLFEALSGRPAFEGQHLVALLAKVIFMEAPRLEEHCPQAPPELATLVSRMLAKDPLVRPRDGVELLTEFTKLEGLIGRTGPAQPSIAEPQASPPHGVLTGDEQRMISVVLIGGGNGEQPVEYARTAPVEVRGSAEEAGGHLEYLADGSIAVTFGGLGFVKDQVTLGAHFALACRAHLGTLPISMATGRGTTHKAASLSEVIERAAQRLEQQERTRAPGPLPVAIDGTTAALLDSRFEWRDSPVGPELWGEHDRGETVRTLLGRPTPCVGRDVELRLLEQAFDTCVEERSSGVLLITAPAGMGKSRLVHEFIQSIQRRAAEAAIWFGRADSARAGSALHLLGHALRGALGIQGNEPLELRHEKLRARLAGHGAPAQAQRLQEFLGELVGAPFPEPGSAQLRAARQDAQLMAGQLQRAFEEFLLAESAEHPVVLILDDLHWGDTASVRFVDMALRAAQRLPVLVLGLARPEVHARFPQLWSERGIREVHLRGLSRRASERLVHAVLGQTLESATLERLITQAEGNAFYLEELIRAVAQGQSTLPDTAVAMVQSRLAALEADARRVLRAASLFGEVFWERATVALLGDMRAHQVRDWLALLVQREVLVRHQDSRLPGEVEFAFRHALLREGAYALLTQEDRVLGHRLAAEWLEQHGESDSLALAEHSERGGELERAVHHYVRAAAHAAEANDAEAIVSCVERGLRCNPQGEWRGALLSMKVGVHLDREQHAEAIALASEALEVLPAGSKRWYMTYHYLFPAVAFSQPAALMGWAQRFLEVSPSPEARAEYIRSAAWLFTVLTITGVKDTAYALLSRMRAESAHLAANEISAWAYFKSCEGSFYHLCEEAPWACRQVDSEVMSGYAQAGLWSSRCVMGSYYGKALMDLGDHAGAETALRENLAVAEQRGDELPLMYARVYLARLLARVAPLEQLDEAEQLARAAITGKNMSLLGVAYGVIAELALRRGALETAEAQARLACEWVRPFPAYSWEIVALRVRILLALGRTAEALAEGEQTLQQFERVGLAGYGELELRLAVSEARDAAGQHEAARELLRTTLSRLRLRVEGLPDAKAKERYLSEVPTQARLLALARAWLGKEAVRVAGLEEAGA